MKLKERRGREKAKFLNKLNEYTKADHCLLCGKHITSPCNSHTVPRFILNKIAENGYVYYGYALQKGDVLGLGDKTGINNAHTFRLICNECDAAHFKNYENPNNLKNFDSLHSNLKKQILCEMAIKAHLSHINMKYRRMLMKDMVTGGRLGKLEQQGKFFFPERADVDEHNEYIDYLFRKHKSNNDPFEVLYNVVLDYKTKIATQTVINFIFDLTGKQVFDPFNLVNNECRYFYLMILPLEDSTRVLFYIEKKNKNNVSGIIQQFYDLSEEEKLHFLFVALVIHDQQFYITPSLARKIQKNDKKLIRLYTKTNEIELENEIEIKNFRKYKNYLLDQKD